MVWPPQSGKLANDPLQKRLNKAGYFEAATTPGLWKHKCQPIQFCLVVDDFRIQYVEENHTLYLKPTLLEYYKFTEDWEGNKLEGLVLSTGTVHTDYLSTITSATC